MHVATITIDHTKVAGDLTDYVVAIVPNSDVGWSTLYATALEGGGDIRIFKAGGVTEIPRENVSFSVSAETGEIHAKFTGTLSGSVDTDIEIHADGISSDYAVTATYGRNEVWTGFIYVSHNGGGDDATGNSNTGTANGGGSLGGATGKLGSATSYDGTDDYSNVGFEEFGAELASFTYQMWLKTSTAVANATISGDTDDDSTGALLFRLNTESNAMAFLVRQDDTPATSNRLSFLANTTVNDNVWHAITGVISDYETVVGQIYVDGSPVTTTTEDGAGSINNTFNNFQYPYFIGAFNNRGSGAGFGETVQDEIRIRKGVNNLSGNRISTDYENQNSATTFYSVASEGGGAPTQNSAFLMFM